MLDAFFCTQSTAWSRSVLDSVAMYQVPLRFRHRGECMTLGWLLHSSLDTIFGRVVLI